MIKVRLPVGITVHPQATSIQNKTQWGHHRVEGISLQKW
ncbi:hypothetical protein VRK_14040 [Vibrio sp. MEBiC08052]|nr:hypothetical protein VRK_14040 [Vibrio sp. MEBiC08052]